MTCLDKFMLNAYLEDKLPLRVKQEIQRHLDTCSSCQIKFEQYLDELDTSDDEVEEVWQTEATIQNVMDKLPAYPMNVLKPVQKQPVQINWKKRSVDIVKKTTIAVAGLAMVVTFGTAVSPTFANYVNGIYASINSSEVTVTKGPYNAKQVVDLFDKKQTDIGVKKAAENGFVQPLDMKVTDQGLTMEISAVVADPLRIIILGSVTDSSGKKIPSFWEDQFTFISSDNVNEFREVRLKDKNGKVIKRLDDQSELLGWLPLPNGENFAYGYGGGLGAFFNEANPMPDELILEMRVKRLTNTKGTWNFDIPIDMRPAKAAMKTVALNKELKTPTGATVELKEARFVPTATQLEFSNSNPNEKVVEGFRYELVDEKGTVVGKWDDMIESDEINSTLNIIGMSHGASINFTEKWQPSTSFVHTYMPLDPAKNLTMKLDAVYTGEKVSSQTKLSLAELEKGPKKVDVVGNQITFKSIEMEVDEEDTSFDIPLEAILAKDIVGLPERWTVKDENGNDAELVWLRVNKKENQDGTIKLEGKLEVRFEKKDVKEISVVLDRVIKENKVDWEVQIKEEKK